MHRAASSSVPISADGEASSRRLRSFSVSGVDVRPVNRLTTLYISSILFPLAALVLLGGCASSTARRGESEGEKRVGIVQEEDEFKFISKIKAEKAREDDKKVDIASFKKSELTRKYSDALPASVNRDQFLLEVVRYLGVKYAYGGNSKSGMDCSGFICQVFKNAANRLLPRSTTEQFTMGERVEMDDLRFGDLVFFNTTGRSPSHVGIYIEDGVFAHASVVEGVTLSSLESTYYVKRFVGARRVVE